MRSHLRVVPDAAPLRALIYARTSHDPTQRAKSTKSQIIACRQETDAAGWTVIGQPIVDDGKSASSRARGERAGWDRVVELIESGDIDVLVTWEWSRATRDLSVYVELERLLMRQGVLLAYQGQVYDLRKAGDRRRVASDSVEAQYEADRTSERVLREKATSAEEGLPSGPAPFGYRRVYDKRTGVLIKQEPDEPDPKEGIPGTAPIVRELAERFLAGETLGRLAKEMQRRGVPTPKPPRDAARTRGWTSSTVGQLLKQPSIAGLRKHARPGHAVAYYKAAWVPIITLEDRERILAILADPSRRMHRGVEPVHLLAHVAVCALCGVPVRHRAKKQKGVSYPAYLCDQTGCRGVYIQAPPTDDVVTRAVLTVLADPASVTALRGDTVTSVTAREEARRRIVELERQREELTTAYRDPASGISPVAFAAALGPLEERITEAKAATVTRAAGPAVLRLATADDQAAQWDAFTIVERRDVIRALFEVRLHRAAVKGTRRWEPTRVEIIPRAR